MELKNFFAQDEAGNVINTPTAYVYLPGTSTLATGLKDKNDAPLSNPFNGTNKGQIQFAAPDGNYDLRVIGGGRDFTIRVRFVDTDGAARAQQWAEGSLPGGTGTLSAKEWAGLAEAAAEGVSGFAQDATAALGAFLDTGVTVEPGFYAKDTGAAFDPPTFAAWQRWQLPVIAGQQLSISSLQNNDGMAVVSFFDADGALVGSPSGTGPSSGYVRYENLKVTVPPGAVLAKGSGWSFDNFDDGFKPAKIRVFRMDVNEGPSAQVLASRPFVKKQWAPANGFFTGAGAFNSSAAWKFQVFDIAPGQKIRIKNAVKSGSAMAGVLFGNGYNASSKTWGEVIQAAENGYDFGPVPFEAFEFECPERADKVAVTVNGDRAVEVFISEPSPPRIRAISKYADAMNPLQGKTAVWFGTSIPAGGGITGSHVSYVAEALGVTITNEAIGGSAARRGVAARRSGSDSYGWTGVYYGNLFVAMGKSDAECTDLIDNWGSKWRALVQGDGGTGFKPAAPLSAEFQNQIRNSSYEVILDRHLGAGNRKDYYIFDHGYNDWGMAFGSESSPGVQSLLQDMETVPGSRFDRSTFIGAMEFYINRIWADNPKARIILIGHFENTRVQNIADGQKLLASRTQLPLCKLWEGTGWSQFQIVGGPADGKTAYEVWLPDGIHPFSDTTGQARDRLAGLLTRWLAANA